MVSEKDRFDNLFAHDGTKARWFAVVDPETPGEVLEDFASDASAALLVRIAEHANAPKILLTLLSIHPNSDVRSAVADNPNTPSRVISMLCVDENPDVRFSIAENPNMSLEILKQIESDENPYVAQRARKTIERLEAMQLVQAAASDQAVVKPPQHRTEIDTGRKLVVLAIEDNLADTRLLEKMLAPCPFELECVDRLSKALPRLAAKKIDVILLDLSLPDAQGLDCFYQVHCQAPHIPIVVLTGMEDESIGSEAVQAGAQDYLVKGQVSAGLLARSIKYAVERHHTESKLKQLNESLERRVIQLATANQELDKLAQSLALSNQQALQAANSKSQFVARISHDIRTPISAVLGITDLLLQKNSRCSEEEMRKLIELIDESARSQLNLLTDILDLSKLEAGKVELEKIDFCPVQLLEDIAELFAASATKKGVSLTTCVDATLQPVLQGDPARLREILLNLTNNAIKFTPPQGEVVLRATRECENENENDDQVTVRFSVTDSGIGLTAADSNRLFEPFVQLHSSHEDQGTGLGLSICKRLVGLMAGEIGADSNSGKGATFWFTVRLKRNRNASITGLRVLPLPCASLTNVRVLVAVHSNVARDTIQRYVRAAGWSGESSVANAMEALDILRRAAASGAPYQVAIVDFGSKASNSFELAAAIQQDPAISSTRLIFLTDFDQRQKGEEAWSAGFSAYLTKPLKQWHLLDCIAKVVDDLSRQTNLQVDTISSVSAQSGISERILVAEDSPVMREVFVQQLEQLGVQVDAVANGREAVEAVSCLNYTLILMDCQMPELTGLEATRAIRKLQAGSHRTPIVAVTSGGPAHDRKSCIEAGMDDYLTKPVSREQLREVLARWSLTGNRQQA